MAFTEDDVLCLYFQTKQGTRKIVNLRVNPYVSLVIGHDQHERQTLQYEGAVQLPTEASDLEICKQRFIAKNSPTTADYFEQPGVLFYKITPVWIGFSDYSGSQPLIIELQF